MVLSAELQVISKLSQQYVCEVLPDMHAEQQGLRREEAELAFLKVPLEGLAPPPLVWLTTCPSPLFCRKHRSCQSMGWCSTVWPM